MEFDYWVDQEGTIVAVSRWQHDLEFVDSCHRCGEDDEIIGIPYDELKNRAPGWFEVRDRAYRLMKNGTPECGWTPVDTWPPNPL